MIVELSAELGHVIALNVLFLQELVLGVGIRAVASEFALTKVNDVFTHLSLPLHFDSLVEFLSLLEVSEILLLLLPCCFAVVIVIPHGFRGLINSSFLEEIVICSLRFSILWFLDHIQRANHDGSIDTTLEATAVLLGDK